MFIINLLLTVISFKEYDIAIKEKGGFLYEYQKVSVHLSFYIYDIKSTSSNVYFHNSSRPLCYSFQS